MEPSKPIYRQAFYGEPIDGWGAKRQDPYPNWGMATVGEESSTHLNVRELNVFGLLTGIYP